VRFGKIRRFAQRDHTAECGGRRVWFVADQLARTHGLRLYFDTESRTAKFNATIAATGKIYVANLTNNSITIYGPGSSGDATPVATISGPNTGLNEPFGLAVDVNGNIYVSNFRGASVTVYAPDASGDAVPTATISGPNTRLDFPQFLTVASNKIYVASLYSNIVTIYPVGANGDAVPIATINGTNTGFANTVGVAVDAADRIYVTNADAIGGGSVSIFAAGASGNATPTATISGPNTGLDVPLGITVDAVGKIYVANNSNPGTASVTIYSPDASGDATPISSIIGPSTGLASTGLALDLNGNIYVTNGNRSPNPNTVTIFAAGASGNAVPIATISGPSTGLSRPYGVAVH
jgi:sugar lactone lactonase YvrE